MTLFDKVFQKVRNGCRIRYGLLRGSSAIVFIKVGAGGSIRGYKDKYLEMARRLRDARGMLSEFISLADLL